MLHNATSFYAKIVLWNFKRCRNSFGVSFSFGDDMKELHELAQEYFENAQNIEAQIKEKKKQIGKAPEGNYFKLHHELAMLQQMHREQMDTYNQLKNYYRR